jgi:pilus assembly protein FimV
VSKSLIRVVAMVVALLTWSMAAYGAGLGKLTVISTLGQPFRGEIDLVSVKKDELSSLTARIASPDAFKQADLPYTAYVSNLKLAIETRPNGEPYLRVSSFQPLNEPFVDFLVELTWSSGRLVRAYTALVDPPVVTDAESSKAPEVKAAPVPAPQPEPRAAAPVPAPAPEPAPVTAQAPVAAPEPAPVPEPVEPAPAAQPPAEPAIAPADRGGVGVAVPEPAEQAGGKRAMPAASSGARGALAGGEVLVKSGDNLSKIAQANMTEGLSLDQMLVLLYRENPEAFAGKNMNRLKTGKVLRLPDDSTVVDMSPQDARKEVRVQAANWNAYREKLAAVAAETPAVETGTPQSSTGKVTTSVQEKAPQAEAPKEVLKLSKGEPAKAGATGQDAKALQDKIRALEEEVAAKTKASKDAGERIASLEKTIKDMQALMAIKSKGMTDLQKPGAQPSVAAPAKPEPAKPEPPKAAAVTPATAPAAGAPAAQAPAATSGTASVTPAPGEEAPKPKKKFVAPPPPPPPSFVDEMLDNPLVPAAGAGALVVLGGLAYYFVKRRRGAGADAAGTEKKAKKGKKKGAAQPLEGEVTEELPSEAPLGGAARGAGDFHEEGDPLAEAEIFLTYGRDNLAEERLKEAIVATPQRFELHGKLLEIYAGRKDIGSFEQVAKELQVGTGGKGEIWNKAARLGYQLDPQNPRYAAGRPDEDDGTATVVVGSAAALASAAAAAAAVVMSRPGGSGDAAKTNLDFNLGFDDSAVGTTTDIDLGRLGPEVEAATAMRTDFDLGALEDSSDMTESVILDPGTQLPGSDNESTVQIAAFEGTAPLPQAEPAATAGGGMDFDFDVSAISPPAPGEAPHEAPDDGGLNFDISGLNLDGPSDASGAGSSMAPDLDLSGINLDLGGSPANAPSGGKDDKWFDVQTKFDLAKAYQEMGDREGAREILQEVLSEGDAEQKAAAQAVLGSLG